MNETIEQKAPKPPGLIPKQVQNYVILGVATLLMLIIWLTSGGDKKARHDSTPANTSDFSRLNQAKLEEYKNQLAAQERLLREQQALLLGQQPTPQSDDLPTVNPSATVNSRNPTVNPQEALKTQLQLEEQKKDYHSLFANNLAFSYRQELKPSSEMEGFREFLKAMGKNPAGQAGAVLYEGNPNGLPQSPKSNDPISPQQVQGFPQASAVLQPGTPSTAGSTQRTEEALASNTSRKATDTPARVDDYNQSSGKSYRVLSGTVIETVLLNRINSDFSGPVNCLVTSPVYSHDRQRILIPEGSKVLGEAQRLANLGQKRVSVAFHRLIMPDGFSVGLDEFKGLNQIGETALRDKVNNHYMRIFGLSVALGLISGFSNRGVTYSGPGISGTDAYRAGVAESLSQSSQRILDRYINILPTVIITEGHRVKVYLTNDLLLPDYKNHAMPDDLEVEQASTAKEEK